VLSKYKRQLAKSLQLVMSTVVATAVSPMVKPHCFPLPIHLLKSVLKDFLHGSTLVNKSLPKAYSVEPLINDNDLECAPEYFLKEAKHGNEEIKNEIEMSFNRVFNYMLNNPYLRNRNIKIDLDNGYKINTNFY